MVVDERRLKDFLFDTGVLPRGELDRAHTLARERDTSLADTLVATGMLRDDDVRRALAHVLGVPFVIISKDMLVPEALSLLPEPFSRARNAVVLSVQGNAVEVALLDIDDLRAVQEHVGAARVVRPRLTNRESLMRALLYYQKHLKDTFGAALAAECARIGAASSMSDASSHDALVRAADLLLSHALHQQAHAVHIEQGERGLRVRYRTQGGLFDAMTLPGAAAMPLIARFKLLAQLPLQSDTPGLGRFKISHTDGSVVGITVSTVPQITEAGTGEKLVLAFVHEGSGRRGLSLAALSWTPSNTRELRRALSARSGLVLVCGDEGAGKTTLLYTLMDQLASGEKSLVSVESQVSYIVPAVAQMEVNEGLGLTPASCLRAQLRQDADVIMVDCALDDEVATLAANAANRGALVLMSVPASSAAEGVEYLQELGVPSALLASTLVASIATATVPRLCPHVRNEHRLSRTEQSELEERIDIKRVLDELKAEHMLGAHTAWKEVQMFDASPCAECEGGYKGTLGLQEVLPVTRTLKDAIRGGAGAEELAAQAKEEGMMTIADDALYKAVQGSVSAEVLLLVAGR